MCAVESESPVVQNSAYSTLLAATFLHDSCATEPETTPASNSHELRSEVKAFADFEQSVPLDAATSCCPVPGSTQVKFTCSISDVVVILVVRVDVGVIISQSLKGPESA